VNCILPDDGVASGVAGAVSPLRGFRSLGNDSGWQLMPSSCSWSSDVGSAGRRLVALFSGWLARCPVTEATRGPGQPRKVSGEWERRGDRRRGWLGSEGAVSILQEVKVGRWRDGVVSSDLRKEGSRVGLGPAQGSPSNYRLKLTARDRSSVFSSRRTRAAA